MRKLLLTTALTAVMGLTGHIGFSAMPAHAGPDDNSLAWASDSIPSNIDFYQHTIREGIVLGRHIWDGLMAFDSATGTFAPHLAESFEFIDDTTLEFRLRRGVLFHNGTELTAADVVATVNYVTTNATPQPIFFLSGAEAIDDYTVRLTMPRIYPPILEYLANLLPIYPAAYYAEVGPEGMSRAPVGTGPYRVTEHVAGESVTMERFPEYFGGVRGQPSIERLTFRRIAEFNTQAIELMTGGLDWIWRVPPDAVEQLASTGAVHVEAGSVARFGFIAMDAAGLSGDHPLRDIRVRQAINHAINREGIRAAMMGDGSELINTICAPVQFGCSDAQVATYDYNPARARELLAEAGFPNGFSIDFHGYRDRAVVEAIIGDLAAVGITTNLQFVPASTIQTLRNEGRLTMWFQAWGSNSVMDVSAAAGFWFDGGVNDYARDARVTELLLEGFTLDTETRLRAYAEALGRISQEALTVPMFTYAMNYAYNPALNFTPQPDETPRFNEASWQ